MLSITDLPASELADIRRASSIKRKLIELPEDLRPHGFKVHEGRLYVNGSELVGLGNAEATSLTSGDLVLTVMLRPYADEIEAAYDAYMATRDNAVNQAQAIAAV